MSDIETGYDADAVNTRRMQEVTGPVHHIKTTLDRARTSFQTVGTEGIIEELTFPSAHVRPEMELRKFAPIRCEECLMPAHAHAIYGGEVDHMPISCTTISACRALRPAPRGRTRTGKARTQWPAASPGSSS